MHETQHTIPDHKKQLVSTVEHIIALVNHDAIKEAIEVALQLHYADLANFFDNTNHKIHEKLLPELIDRIKPETFAHIGSLTLQSMVDVVGVSKIATLLDKLVIEDAIEVIENIEEDIRPLILSELKPEKRQQIIEGFQYPDNTVGRVIEKNFIAFQRDWTVGQAIDFIYMHNPHYDFHAAIVIDTRMRPVGSILLSTLLKHNKSDVIKNIMNSDLVIVDAFTELSEIVFIFKQYALTIVPVISKNGKIVGTVSIDSMLYIVAAQAEKGTMHLGGVHTYDTYYNILRTARHRFPWLFFNMLTSFIASFIIERFSETIAKLISIAIIMPIVAAICGNSGTQVMTVTVCALNNKNITSINIFRVIIKEMIVAALNGFLLASIATSISFVILSNPLLCIIFGIAIFITFIIAAFFGAIIPILIDKIKLDPAIASGVCVSAITDAVSFFIFLALAYTFLV